MSYRREGVDSCGDGAEALYLATEYPFDAAIVDLGLPGLGGLDVIARLRRQGSRLPLLVLTARGRWQDKVQGLEAGADDYLTKPFAFEELLARVRALLRRQSSAQTSVLKFADLEMDLIARRVTRAGTAITLTAKEFSLLEYFLRNPNRPLSRTSIAEHVWDARQSIESGKVFRIASAERLQQREKAVIGLFQKHDVWRVNRAPLS